MNFLEKVIFSYWDNNNKLNCYYYSINNFCFIFAFKFIKKSFYKYRISYVWK